MFSLEGVFIFVNLEFGKSFASMWGVLLTSEQRDFIVKTCFQAMKLSEIGNYFAHDIQIDPI